MRRQLFQVPRTTGAKAAGGGRSVNVEDGATKGATLGVDLLMPDGSRVRLEDILNRFARADSAASANTLWRLIREIPENVSALAAMEAAGLYVVTGPGTSAARAITGQDGEVVVSEGRGLGGDPKIGLADVPDAGGGTLQKTEFDEKGRRTGTSSATTDDLPEGASLYHTDERARAAAVADGIDPSVADVAPSQRAVAQAIEEIELTPGPPGRDGQIRFTGVGLPGVIVGAEPGDTYMDLSTGDIYKLT